MKLTHRDTGDSIEVPDEAVTVYRKAGWEPEAETVAAADSEPPSDEDSPSKGRKPRT